MQINKDSKSDLKTIKANLNKEFTSSDIPDNLVNKEIFKKQMEDLHNSFSAKIKDTSAIDKTSSTNQENDSIGNIKEFDIKTPSYLQEVYTWAYLNPKNVKLLDRNLVVHILLFFNANRLIRSYLQEVKAGNSMLQIAHVYGDMTPRLAKKIGPNGRLDLIDVAKVQLAHAYKKLKDFNYVDMWQQDATVGYHRDYDIVGSFFLIHEVPMKAKVAIIDNMLQQVEHNNAKAVFIDYHRPSTFHPLRPIMKLVNTFLEPFANELWEYNIQDLAKEPSKFNWTKTTFFGGMYQKVVVTKK